ncbi:MAG: glycoside hydrolase family 97 protein [Flavisolibacter sp.]
MKYLLFLLSIIYSVADAQQFTTFSPDKNIRLNVNLQGGGEFTYSVNYKTHSVILPSSLAMKLKEPTVNLNQFTLVSVDSSTYDQTWNTVWGEYSSIRDHHNQVRFRLQDKSGSGILVDIVFRIFNEGVGFRYEFPTQAKLLHFVVDDENTQFHLTGDHKAFWIPGDFDSNEYPYNETKLSQVHAMAASNEAIAISVRTPFNDNGVQTPLMMKTTDGLYVNIHEAALSNYAAMDLQIDKSTFTLRSILVPDAVGNKAYLVTPALTPWRTIIVSDNATDIIAANRMILNLNEPSKVENTSFIKPQKFVGVWWEMHVNKSSWDYSGSQVGSQQVTKVPHGANTANVKRYIDFAAKNGIDGVLVEGWNTGWEDWFGKWKEDVFDFVTPYPDYDVNELNRYAASKGVKIICHHETSGSATNYERQMDTAYRFMINHGMNSVKTGYVGKIIPRGEHHDGQWMVRHYVRVAEKTARYGIMVDMHEPVRPTGLQRTYPNWVACEAARGNEFNAWSVGNPPMHETILPFTRLMGGPMDYTPGIFQIKMSYYNPEKKEQVHTTLTKQLALYVTMYSPLQMAADLPENYEAHMDAFQFIKDVAVDWDDTKVLQAEPGDYLIMARKAKNSPNWFLGAITDEQARNFAQSLRFLDPNKKYVAKIYHDAANADWQKNPMAYAIDSFIVDSKTTLKLNLAPGGGTAISFMPATDNELKTFKTYK